MIIKKSHFRLAAVSLGASAFLSFASIASAQGALSVQGFGYPVGGLSTKSLGTAGATSEFDILSVRNPSAASTLGSAVLSVQGELETRTATVGEKSDESRLQRMPLAVAGIRIKQLAFVVSTSTLLDRTYFSESQGTAVIDGLNVPTVDRLESRGSMNEHRFSAAWSWRRFDLGAAVLAITGEHYVQRMRAFPESPSFSGVMDSSRIGFEGVGVAAGLNWQPLDGLMLGASWRSSGSLKAVKHDVAISEADIPGRVGLGVLYQGIPGAVFSASLENIKWSAMNGLGSDASSARDATNWAVGGEFASGSFRRAPIMWRIGYSQRELPFLLRQLPVNEQTFNAGLGLPITAETAALDFSVQRSKRSVTGNQADENAWGLSAALTIRP